MLKVLEVLRKKCGTSDTLSTTYTWTGLGLNLDLCSEEAGDKPLEQWHSFVISCVVQNVVSSCAWIWKHMG